MKLKKKDNANLIHRKFTQSCTGNFHIHRGLRGVNGVGEWFSYRYLTITLINGVNISSHFSRVVLFVPVILGNLTIVNSLGLNIISYRYLIVGFLFYVAWGPMTREVCS